MEVDNCEKDSEVKKEKTEITPSVKKPIHSFFGELMNLCMDLFLGKYF